jgi:hypothetical protein
MYVVALFFFWNRCALVTIIGQSIGYMQRQCSVAHKGTSRFFVARPIMYALLAPRLRCFSQILLRCSSSTPTSRPAQSYAQEKEQVIVYTVSAHTALRNEIASLAEIDARNQQHVHVSKNS